MKKTMSVLAALLVLTASGCARKVNIEAERAAILAVDRELLEAVKAKDVDRFLSTYTDDVWVLPPNAPITTDKKLIRELWSGLFANSTLTWQVTRTEESSAGDLGYTIGLYEVTTNGPDGKPVTERGKYVGLWKKQPNGTWKQPVDIWNSNEPLRPGASR